jgi:hypothetical protein
LISLSPLGFCVTGIVGSLDGLLAIFNGFLRVDPVKELKWNQC